MESRDMLISGHTHNGFRVQTDKLRGGLDINKRLK
jgi:hypothetical protein